LELLQLLNGKNKFSVNVISLFFSSDLWFLSFVSHHFLPNFPRENEIIPKEGFRGGGNNSVFFN
jgi:hypothetical protein